MILGQVQLIMDLFIGKKKKVQGPFVTKLILTWKKCRHTFAL